MKINKIIEKANKNIYQANISLNYFKSTHENKYIDYCSDYIINANNVLKSLNIEGLIKESHYILEEIKRIHKIINKSLKNLTGNALIEKCLLLDNDDLEVDEMLSYLEILLEEILERKEENEQL